MTLSIFVTSPLPANMDRSLTWNEHQTFYDSGVYQGATPYTKPLYKYTFSLSNIPRSKQSSLHAFYNSLKGGTTPFLLQDPYDYSSPGYVVVNTGTNPSSFMLKSAEGWPIFPKSGSVLLTSNLSGNLTQGTHWNMDADRGIIVASLRPSSADFWTVRSAEFFRKVVFTQYNENSQIWNQFAGQVVIEEIAIP